MSSNPSYDEQINQFDKRIVLGGQHRRDYRLSDTLKGNMGLQYRHDDTSRVGVDFFNNGQFLAPNGDNQIEQSAIALYATVNWQASPKLRVQAGLRGDYYNFDVKALNTISVEGTDQDSIVSPKFGLAYQISDQLEAYANWGYGLHEILQR